MNYLYYLGDIDKRFGDIDCKYLCTGTGGISVIAYPNKTYCLNYFSFR